MKALFVRRVQRHRLPTVRLAQFLEFIWLRLNREIPNLPKVASLTIVFSSPAESARLNHQYRSKNKPTDVLSFSPIEPKSLGELVLCPEIILAQAKDHEWSDFNEYAYMILHGTLHLLGFDHEKDDKKARQMYRLQDRIFDDYLKKVKKNERRHRTTRD